MQAVDKFNIKKYIGITVLVCSYLALCIADARQQNSYENVRIGYRAMAEGNYEEASENFSEYLSMHSSGIYWRLVEIVNGLDSEYSYQSVENALKICEMEISK